jgi:hypothetical protein
MLNSPLTEQYHLNRMDGYPSDVAITIRANGTRFANGSFEWRSDIYQLANTADNSIPKNLPDSSIILEVMKYISICFLI